MTATIADLYDPPDSEGAFQLWKANCGPAAFAAILGRPVMDCRPFFPRFPARPWTNPTHMRAALTMAGVAHTVSKAPITRGLAFIQWEGPWSGNEARVLEAYRHTHWLAVAGGMLYDVNAGWLTAADWERELVPLFLAHDRRYTGWSVRTRISLRG
jgi:hypothetical protein